MPCSLTMIDSSDIAGTYAPPAVHEPITTAICGMPFRRQRGLIVEDAAEMIAVGKDVGLVGQIGAARVDQIDAGQTVLARDVLRAQVLLHRHRIVGAALDRGVVADDDAFASRDAADAGDDAGRGDVVVVHPVGRELRQLEERRARVEQRAHALARQELAAPGVARARASPPPCSIAATFALRSATSAAIASRFFANAASRVSSRDSMTAMLISPPAGREPAIDLVEPVHAPERLAVDDNERRAEDSGARSRCSLAAFRASLTAGSSIAARAAAASAPQRAAIATTASGSEMSTRRERKRDTARAARWSPARDRAA